ncbi:MAG TPA: hypothetical protein VFI11_11960 [Anaerolineales bacterium]|nr:hypothetical protein [Anaerolineales bacterium]
MRSGRPSLWGIALLSCASLAYEVGLTRLYAIQQFYHFAFLVVSLAVMSLAASGLLLSVQRRTPPLAWMAAGFSVAVLASYLVLQLAPFDSYSIAWEPRQILILALDVAAAGAPFLLSGWVTGASLAQSPAEARRPYAASLLGGALGPPLALVVTDLGGAESVIFISVALGLAAASALTTRREGRVVLLALAGLALAPPIRMPASWRLRLSPYKPLAMARLLPDARQAASTWSAFARLDVVESSAFHIFPGLSLNARVELPPQHAAFLDGEGPMPLTAIDASGPQASELAAAMPSGLGYALRPGASTLVLRPGGGLEVTLALASGATSVTAIYDEPLIFEALSGPFLGFTRSLAVDPRVQWIAGPQRSGLARLSDDFDLIVISLSDPYRPIRSGAFSLNEEYGLTLQALTEALQHLKPDGLLVLTRWLGTPPSDETRAWATLVAAMSTPGAEGPEDRMLAYRSMRTATLIASPRSFSPAELATVRSLLEASGYDPIYLPDLRPEELNRHNQLPEDVYHTLFTGWMLDPETTLSRAEMDVRPTSDDRPFYFQFFRWRQTPEVLAQLGMTWQPFGGSGFLVLLLLLGVVLILALGLVLLTARLAPRGGTSRPSPGRSMLYFAAVGLGFLVIEVTLIQQLVLLLDRPGLSLVTVLGVLLLSSGLGSLISHRVRLVRLLPSLALYAAILTWAIPWLSPSALGWPLPARVALCAAVLFPLGVGMGIPFAGGLRLLERIGPPLVPWAWTANGAASGVAGPVAALLVLSAGFKTTLVVGAAMYLIAWLVAPRHRDAGYQSSGM